MPNFRTPSVSPSLLVIEKEIKLSKMSPPQTLYALLFQGAEPIKD